MPLPELLANEAVRQLNICNACRYCEGYCAVFPALERRTTLGVADLEYLANLCHDCRDCYYACPYVPPHVFAVNPPQLFSEIRRASYEEAFGDPSVNTRHRSRLRSLFVATIFVTVLIIGLVGVSQGLGALWRIGVPSGSPYQVISYPLLIGLAIAASAWSVAVFSFAAAKYWKRTGGHFNKLSDGRAIARALRYAAELRYMRGGGAGCAYPRERSKPIRRILHNAVAYGFVACFASTISAAVLQDLIGHEPPYAIVSVPVLLGIGGGAAIVVGCAGLIALKMHADPQPGDPVMAGRDYSLLVALILLALSGLLTLVLRHTQVFGLVLLIHLATVITAILVAPYSKFLHVPLRFLAITQANLEAKITRTPK